MHYEGSLEDITARREPKQLLRESEARKAPFWIPRSIRSLPFNHQGQITEFNPAAEKILAVAGTR